MARRSAATASDEKIKEAIKWLESGGGVDAAGTAKPGTKKGACEILGVASNATMERLIQEWKEEQAFSAEQRKKKRGTAITDVERANMVEAFLQGDPLDEISKRLHRSTALIKAELERQGANLKYTEVLDPSKPLSLNPPELPDAVIATSFEIGELVWVSAYQCIGEIRKQISEDVYRVYLLDEAKQMNVHQHVWDLGSTKHFQKLGVNVKSLGFIWTKDQAYPILQGAIEKALKMAKEKRD